MWQQIARTDDDGLRDLVSAEGAGRSPRRAYYRVSGFLPIRITPLAPEGVEAAIFDLGLPDPLAAGAFETLDEKSGLALRLRRIEEKLDHLLGAASIDAARPLSGRDRRFVTFSGAGLALDVDFSFAREDAFKVGLLLPLQAPRVVRAVARAVDGADERGRASDPRRLALAFHHIEAADRDALVAYSYDLQRQSLRARTVGANARP